MDQNDDIIMDDDYSLPSTPFLITNGALQSHAQPGAFVGTMGTAMSNFTVCLCLSNLRSS
jgi:hypothetical protein